MQNIPSPNCVHAFPCHVNVCSQSTPPIGLSYLSFISTKDDHSYFANQGATGCFPWKTSARPYLFPTSSLACEPRRAPSNICVTWPVMWTPGYTQPWKPFLLIYVHVLPCEHLATNKAETQCPLPMPNVNHMLPSFQIAVVILHFRHATVPSISALQPLVSFHEFVFPQSKGMVHNIKAPKHVLNKALLNVLNVM